MMKTTAKTTLRTLYLALLLLLTSMLSLATMPPLFAQSEQMCEDHAPMIDSLHHCVIHAAEMGHIANPGIVRSLVKKLEGAQAALKRGERDAAINHLQAFRQEVIALRGKQIDADHAAHMIMHVDEVIAALRTP